MDLHISRQCPYQKNPPINRWLSHHQSLTRWHTGHPKPAEYLQERLSSIVVHRDPRMLILQCRTIARSFEKYPLSARSSRKKLH